MEVEICGKAQEVSKRRSVDEGDDERMIGDSTDGVDDGRFVTRMHSGTRAGFEVAVVVQRARRAAARGRPATFRGDDSRYCSIDRLLISMRGRSIDILV